MSGNRMCISRNLKPTPLHRVCSLDVHGVSRPLHGTAYANNALHAQHSARNTHDSEHGGGGSRHLLFANSHIVNSQTVSRH